LLRIRNGTNEGFSDASLPDNFVDMASSLCTASTDGFIELFSTAALAVISVDNEEKDEAFFGSFEADRSRVAARDLF